MSLIDSEGTTQRAMGSSRRSALKAMALGAAVGAMWDASAHADVTDRVFDTGGAVVNVRAFGAIGDGVADDTTAIRSAIAAAFDPIRNARSRVFLPAGTYRISGVINVDYGLVLDGAGPAVSIIKMDAGVLSNMFVGAGGFPVHVEFRNLTLDGGFTWSNSKASVPAGSGSVNLVGSFSAGTFYQPVQIGGGTAAIAFGDVLRLSNQPPTFSVDGTTRPIGYSGGIYNALWSPHASISGTSNGWKIFKVGDLIANVGRLVIDNCFLFGAKRHCINLLSGGEVRITRCKLGVSQGCGVFSHGGGDGAIENCWFMTTGGANIYTSGAFDFRFHDCLIEGGSVANVYSDWGQVKIDSCDLWGGRAGNIVANHAHWVRGVNLQLRDPGGGGTDNEIGPTSWSRVTPRSAIDCQFSNTNAGALLTNIALISAADAGGTFQPRSIVSLSNGTRSSLAQVEFENGITFAAGTIEDHGTGTIVRGVRGYIPPSVGANTVTGSNVVVTNPIGMQASLLIKTTSTRILTVLIDGVEVFNGGSSGAELWQRQYSTPPIAPGGAVTLSTLASESSLITRWFPA